MNLRHGGLADVRITSATSSDAMQPANGTRMTTEKSLVQPLIFSQIELCDVRR